jgi:AcrR family transcriptional regulator
VNDQLRDRRSVEERREQLVDAAIEVLAAEGLTKATTRRITDHAGLALGAFHYAFRSKDDLLQAVIERIATRVEQAFADAVSDPGRGVEVALGSLVEGFWELVESTPDLQLAQYELTVHALRDPGLKPLAMQQYERYVAAVSEHLSDVRGAPDGEELEDLARFLVATLDGLVLQSFVHEDPEAARRRLDLQLRCLSGVVPSHVS